MTSGEALEMVKTVAATSGFSYEGDAIHCLVGAMLDEEQVDRSLARATACVACPVGWRVTCVSPMSETLDVDLRLTPSHAVLSLRIRR